jgi:hypothetical protein
MAVYIRALNNDDVASIARHPTIDPDNSITSAGTDDGQNIGVLALLQRGVRNLDSSVHDTVSKALAGAEVLNALIILLRYGSPLLQVHLLPTCRSITVQNLFDVAVRLITLY